MKKLAISSMFLFSALILIVGLEAQTGTFFVTDGKVGIGTEFPAYAMEMKKTGENSAFVLDRTDGATNYINATSQFGNFGTVTNHPLRLLVGSRWRMRLNTDGTLAMSDGGSYNGTWNNASSRDFKENIHNIEANEALQAIEDLQPVKFNYKLHREEERMGFIAEDVPELVAMNGKKNLNGMDIVAVLTKVTQEQQNLIQEQRKAITELSERMKLLERAVILDGTLPLSDQVVTSSSISR